MSRPQESEVNQHENSNVVVEKRTEEIPEKEGEKKIKQEPQDTALQGGEQNPAEKDQRKDVPEDMSKVKEDSTAGKPAENQDQSQLQDQEKQSAATSLLAQLLGNVSAQAATPEYLPRTPLPEPLTDASTPVAPNEDNSLPLINGQTEKMVTSTQPEVQNGDITVPKQEDNPLTQTQIQSILPTDTPFDIPDDSAATRIPDMVTGVMEDPLSKTSHDHSALFAPFDADGSIKTQQCISVSRNQHVQSSRYIKLLPIRCSRLDRWVRAAHSSFCQTRIRRWPFLRQHLFFHPWSRCQSSPCRFST